MYLKITFRSLMECSKDAATVFGLINCLSSVPDAHLSVKTTTYLVGTDLYFADWIQRFNDQTT